jgi:putative serine protease PepD
MSDGSVREGAPGTADPAGPPGQAVPADPPGQAASAANGAVGPAAPNGAVGPAAPNGMVSPAAPNGGMSPAVSNGGVGPAASNGVVGPAAPNGVAGPAVSNGVVGPGAPNGAAGPAVSNGVVSPVAPNGGVSPAVSNGAAGPVAPPGPAHPPGDVHAPAANPPYPADLSYGPELDGPAGPNGAPADRNPKPPAESPPDKRLAGSRLLVVILAIAVASALVGGIIGGFVGSRPLTGTQPTYSLGTVAPALTNRPPDSVAGIAARVLPSVVMIKVNGDEGTGSGFIISGGYILTNNHVVTLDGAVNHASLQVVFNGGQTASARLVGTDPYSDIAVLRLAQPVRLPALTLGNSASAEVGDPVVAFGSPLGLANTVTSGIVSALNRPIEPSVGGSGNAPQVYYDAIQTDAPINPGNSGGPLVNAQGQVIGINAEIDTLGGDPVSGIQGGNIGLGFAIPINQVRVVATELIRTGRAAYSVIGALVNTDYTGNGAQIAQSHASITPGGPAAQAGLQPGDVIIRFAGQPITDATSLLDAIRSQQPGTRVSFTFIRSGATHTATLTLGSAESLQVIAT